MKKQIYILFLILSSVAFSQGTITVTDIQRTGNFALCGGAGPNVTAQIVTSTGSTVQNNSLVITDPCGYTTIRINMTNLRYNQPSANWVHGFFFPEGDNMTVSNVSLPAGWIPMTTVTGASCSAQETGGVGFYYDGSVGSSCTECFPSMNDGIPSNNYGQSSMNCSSPFSIQFDMTFCNSKIETTSTQFVLKGTSDGNTGCWSSPDVQNNTVSFKLNTVASEVPLYSEIPNSPQVITQCSGGGSLNYVAEFAGSCGSGSEITWWSGPSGGVMLGTGSPFYYDPPGAACPQGLIFYASCCPPGEECQRFPVVVGQCSPPDNEPTFAPIPPQCPGGSNPLPSTSLDGSTGTWSPAFDPNNTTTYTFTPNPGQCATQQTQVVVEILPLITITFTPLAPICQNSVPPDLPSPQPTVDGSWSPATIDTSTPGTYQYTFTPVDVCAEPVTIDITILEEVIPQFSIVNTHYCEGTELIDLPTTSDNGYPGQWMPAQIDTSVVGSTTYVFTPNGDDCVETYSITIEVEEMIIPTFDSVPELCQNSTAPGLPQNHEGLSGTWSPATIDTSTPGTYDYTFTPDRECSEPVTVQIVIHEEVIPQFNISTVHYCEGTDIIDLPTTSDNGYPGQWNPAQIDTSVVGSTTYTFTPDDNMCAETYSVTIEVEEMIIPTFEPIPDLCQYSTAPDLPANPEGLTGVWSPATIDTNTTGTFDYTFTPDRECSESVTIQVVITPDQVAQFDIQNSYCQDDTPQTLSIISNNNISGSWSPATIDTSTPGVFTYTFTPDDDQCSHELAVNIEIFEEPVLNSVSPVFLCDEDFDGIYHINLTSLNPSLGGGAGITYAYYGSLNDYNNNNPIPNGQWNDFQTTTLPRTIYITGSSIHGCISEAVAVVFSKGETVEHSTGPFEIEFCNGETLDLTQLEALISGMTGVQFEYFNDQNSANNNLNPIPNPEDFLPTSTQNSAFVRIEMDGYCSAIVKIDLIRNPIPSVETNGSFIICEGEEFEATATSDNPNSTFVWTLPDGSEVDGPTIIVTGYGTYTVIAISERGCVSLPVSFTVSAPTTPIITSVDISGNTVTIGATNGGQGGLEYSLDGILWQTSNQFTGLTPGETYTVWVRSGGCIISKYDFTILFVPNFISPNGDGKNDVWSIRGIQSFPGATLKIFDRYGKIFVDTKFNGDYVWNGKYMGRNVASDDYWYIIQIPATTLTPEQKLVGHISVRSQ